MTPSRFIAVVVAVLSGCVTFPKTADAQTTLTFNKQTGLFTIGYHTVDVVKSAFVFWHDSWQWSGVDVRGEASGPGQYTIAGTSAQTGLTVTGSAVQAAANEFAWNIKLTRSGDSSGKEWGGISFKLDLSPLATGGFKPSAKLLPDNAGWELQLEAEKPPLQVTFSPRPSDVFFERGNVGEIRVYFNKAEPPLPSAPFTMTVRLSPGGSVEPAVEERVAAPDPSSWYSNLTFWNRSPVDLSFMNEPERPAGKRGFLGVRNGTLTFDDGHAARFWGTNLTAAALFSTDFNNIRGQARRLSQLGFNLVRIHHHDSAWVSPNVFGTKAPNTRSLSPQSLRQLDWWIKCLKDEGIYIWLDLEVGRAFTATDGIDSFAEIAKGKPAALGKGFSYFNESIKSRMKEFAKAYLTHVNTYTGLSYKDDPAIAFVLLTNENDLTHHFGNWLLPNKNVPEHNAIYMREAKEFAQRHGLDPDRTWRSWEYGPSKIFLNDMEHRFNVEMIGYLRALGVRVPIATTSSWSMTLAGLPSLTDGDVVDVHCYSAPNFLSPDPRYQANLVDCMSAASVSGKPLTATEWNVSPFPAMDRSALPTYVASIASLQGWSALMEFAYSQCSLDRPRLPDNWDMENDPTMLAMMPAAALLYRQGHMREGAQTYFLSPDAQALMGQPLSPDTSRAIRTLTERSRLRVVLPDIPELPWLAPDKPGDEATIVRDFESDFSSAPTESGLCTDTGEACRDWRSGVFTVKTPRSQIAAGWIGGKNIELNNVTLRIETANAAVAVQSLDGLPIGKSERILISMAAQSLPFAQSTHDTRIMLSEPVVGDLKVRAIEGLHVFRLTANGTIEPLHTEFSEGVYKLRLDRNVGSYWVMLEK